VQTLRRLIGTSFGSALAGGLVVLVAGVILIETGAVKTENGSSSSATLAPAALARPTSASGKALTVNEIYRRDAQGVAFIKSDLVQRTPSVFGLPQQQEATATGSGFLIDNDGHILTNAHVVEGAKDVEVQLGDGDTQSAQIDDTNGVSPLPLGASDEVQVGDPVVAIGNPFGLDRTVTSGIVSALQRQIQAPNGFSISDVIQTDAPINPGNSGGPLIDGDGEVIGINSQIESQSGGNQGIGFAVPSNTAVEVVNQLQDGGQVQHAYLGISGGSLTPEIANALELPVEEGILVEEVLQNGPADDAGIKGPTGEATVAAQTIPAGGDIITKVDGKPVSSMDELISVVNDHQPGDDLTLTVWSGDRQKEVTVKLGDRPANVQDSSSNSLP
jgi:S1-C subfamily serine protease